ncbi:hypothetical protein [Ehrlichia ruminantium]|nr:hypothetical protein [Ehrlichia ruminantium]
MGTLDIGFALSTSKKNISAYLRLVTGVKYGKIDVLYILGAYVMKFDI